MRIDKFMSRDYSDSIKYVEFLSFLYRHYVTCNSGDLENWSSPNT